MAVDWELTTWELEETIFVCFYVGYFILNWLLWNTVVIKPMALIAVFAHEFCHASACWLTVSPFCAWFMHEDSLTETHTFEFHNFYLKTVRKGQGTLLLYSN
jgi:hypothetical protein